MTLAGRSGPGAACDLPPSSSWEYCATAVLCAGSRRGSVSRQRGATGPGRPVRRRVASPAGSFHRQRRYCSQGEEGRGDPLSRPLGAPEGLRPRALLAGHKPRQKKHKKTTRRSTSLSMASAAHPLPRPLFPSSVPTLSPSGSCSGVSPRLPPPYCSPHGSAAPLRRKRGGQRRRRRRRSRRERAQRARNCNRGGGPAAGAVPPAPRA